ncbi:MAG: GNAT family N-acetyltransferase [Anaerofustis sp.]
MRMQTERLYLYPSDSTLSAGVAEYFLRNRDFLSSTEPKREESFFTEAVQFEFLCKDSEESGQGVSAKFWFAEKQKPDHLIGSVGLSNIVREPFQSCFLSYRGDKDSLCAGYVTEAVDFIVAYAFNELNLHRIEANIMPRNAASLRVAEKLGFRSEGLSRSYLRIGNKWEDHIHMVILNSHDETDMREEIQ